MGQSTEDGSLKELEGVRSTLKGLGYTTIEELAAALSAVSAERDQAVAARDKLASANEEAQKIIRSKAGEKGQLQAEIDQLKQKVAELEDGAPPGKKKHEEKTLAELEAEMTDEEWDIADKFFGSIADPDTKRKLVHDEAERVRVLKMIKEDKQIKPIPQTMRPQKTPKTTTEDNMAKLFGEFKKRHEYVPMGPLTGAAALRTVLPSPGQRPVDTRVH